MANFEHAFNWIWARGTSLNNAKCRRWPYTYWAWTSPVSVIHVIGGLWQGQGNDSGATKREKRETLPQQAVNRTPRHADRTTRRPDRVTHQKVFKFRFLTYILKSASGHPNAPVADIPLLLHQHSGVTFRQSTDSSRFIVAPKADVDNVERLHPQTRSRVSRFILIIFTESGKQEGRNKSDAIPIPNRTRLTRKRKRGHAASELGSKEKGGGDVVNGCRAYTAGLPPPKSSPWSKTQPSAPSSAPSSSQPHSPSSAPPTHTPDRPGPNQCNVFGASWNLLAFNFDSKDSSIPSSAFSSSSSSSSSSSPSSSVTTSDITKPSGRPPFDAPSSPPLCYTSQFTNAIYVLNADAADPSSVYIFDATASSWSKQQTTLPDGFGAILDRDTNVFYALTKGNLLMSLDMGLLKSANATALNGEDGTQEGSGSGLEGYEFPTMALAQNHVHFVGGVPGLKEGEAKIFVIHYSYLQPAPQSYGLPAFPTAHGRTASFFRDDSVQTQFAYIPDDGSAAYVVDVTANSTTSLPGPPAKDAYAAYAASPSVLVQLASEGGKLGYVVYDQEKHSGGTWAEVSGWKGASNTPESARAGSSGSTSGGSAGASGTGSAGAASGSGTKGASSGNENGASGLRALGGVAVAAVAGFLGLGML
ncbi:hypothetical protein FA13DRAFT_1718697 [Coprinellus micaceus]|uniref:Uncharacterized protein n=1 Tax=Coprinellus micaceus TaxID=71717 RepID=A0A4Y7SDJ2_COPMI|nr:hypothetical protein FA13DRAFT_1718697 [Coprinellus micaceus]